MNFGLNRLQKHHFDPRNRLDLGAVEESGSAAEEFDSNGGTGGGEVEREHMFDKVVTPSDVGKLNRLVIPKQHAERFFPLDSSTNEKGLLLNFEDRNGKSWRFRYSYWNSSQSYVMTKGWSRFVKEKRLDAGDIVSFQRGVGDTGRDRLYIDWRRRPELPIDHHHHHHHTLGIQPSIVMPTGATAWGSLVWQPLSTAAGYHHHPAALISRDHTQLSRINNNNNNNNNNWRSRGCYPYESSSSEMMYLRREERRVAPRLGDVNLEGKNQMQQEYFSIGGAGSMVVQGNNIYEEVKSTKNNNYISEDQDQDQDTPVKRSRLRLFGVNMEMNSPNISSSSHES